MKQDDYLTGHDETTSGPQLKIIFIRLRILLKAGSLALLLVLVLPHRGTIQFNGMSHPHCFMVRVKILMFRAPFPSVGGGLEALPSHSA